MTNALERLVEQLRRLPGIGSKSARRLAYHLVERPPRGNYLRSEGGYASLFYLL